MGPLAHTIRILPLSLDLSKSRAQIFAFHCFWSRIYMLLCRSVRLSVTPLNYHHLVFFGIRKSFLRVYVSGFFFSTAPAQPSKIVTPFTKVFVELPMPWKDCLVWFFFFFFLFFFFFFFFFFFVLVFVYFYLFIFFAWSASRFVEKEIGEFN